MQNLVKKEYKIPFILVTSLFFLWGFAHAILDVLNKHFQDVLVITRAHSAWVQVMFYLGYFVMAIPAGLFINKYGYRKGVVFGLLLYGIGSLLFIPGEYWMSFNFFLFSLFVIACGLVFLETVVQWIGLYLRSAYRGIVIILGRGRKQYIIALHTDGDHCIGSCFGIL